MQLKRGADIAVPLGLVVRSAYGLGQSFFAMVFEKKLFFYDAGVIFE